MANVTIKNVNSAVTFLRYARRNFVNGPRLVRYTPLGNQSHEEIIAEAQGLIARMDQKDAARLLVMLKAAKGVCFGECRCERCGATLTAPESVAAGIGPECQRA